MKGSVTADPTVQLWHWATLVMVRTWHQVSTMVRTWSPDPPVSTTCPMTRGQPVSCQHTRYTRMAVPDLPNLPNMVRDKVVVPCTTLETGVRGQNYLVYTQLAVRSSKTRYNFDKLENEFLIKIFRVNVIMWKYFQSNLFVAAKDGSCGSRARV